MEPTHLHYFPLTAPYALALLVAFAFLVALIELHILVRAYETMGVHPRYVSALLLFSLLGGAVNFPVAQLPTEETVTDQRVVDFYGVQYVVPVVRHWPGTVIAVNLGGAVIPTLLSIYLLIRNRLLVRGVIGIALVAIVVHHLAYPVRGVGIATPTLVPPLVAAVVALLLGWRSAAPLAYAAGSMGTLVGADLMNLGAIRGLGAPVASIGGAGTFDGIFLSGVLAGLLTWSPPQGRVGSSGTPEAGPQTKHHVQRDDRPGDSPNDGTV